MALAPLIIAASLIVDRVFGDPHTPYHPVALLGRFIGWWGSPARYPKALQRIAGVIFCFGTAFLFAAPFLAFELLAPWYLYLLLAPFLLKVCFAWRALEEHAGAVVAALASGVEDGRAQVSMMVSRDTGHLGREEVLSAAYESMTENLVDSIISPLFYFSLFGLAGAAFFRAANTMDAMLGYRDERIRIGWAAARLDDILNYLPARVCGLILLAYFAAKGRFRPAWEALRRDAKKRPGFNGGIPMATIAGGVGVCLKKPGVYTLGNPERTLEEAGGDIVRAVRAGAVIFAVLAMTALFLLFTLANM